MRVTVRYGGVETPRRRTDFLHIPLQQTTAQINNVFPLYQAYFNKLGTLNCSTASFSPSFLFLDTILFMVCVLLYHSDIAGLL